MSALESGSTQRSANRSRVIGALRQRGAMSRGALADVGLSRSTVHSVVEELLDAGTVIEVGPRADRNTGRPPILVGLQGSLGATVGVEIANGVVRAAICNAAQELLLHDSVPVDEHTQPVPTLQQISELIDRMLARTGFLREQVIGVGIAMPGPIQRRSGLIGRACTLKPWVGVNARTL